MRFTTLPLLTLLPAVLAASNSTSEAVFIYNSTASATDGNYLIWAINAVESTGDIYFHLEAPASGSWAGVGFGSQMAGSLMIVAYPSSNGTGITISPRIGSGHTEPAYQSDITVDKIWDSGLVSPNYVNETSEIMYIDGVCRNCTSWTGGSLDLSSDDAPFIFAVGPGEPMASDDPNSPLQMHVFHGSFTMDMVAATSETSGAVPEPVDGVYTVDNASSATSTGSDSTFASSAHGCLMLLSFLIIFPIGSLVLRVFNKVILHAIVQCIGVFFVLVAFGLGCYITPLYIRSKKFQSAHQIIGLFLMMGLLAQLGLGIVGHRIFKKTGQPAKFGKVHLILGPVLIIFAIIDGGLGWNLAGASWVTTHFVVVVIAIALIFFAFRTTAQFCMRRRQRDRADPAVQNAGPGDYQYPQFVAPKQPYTQTVPLQTFHSSESVPQYSAPPYSAHGQAHQPRPMV